MESKNKFCPDCGKDISEEFAELFLGFQFCGICYKKRESIILESNKIEQERKTMFAAIRKRLDTSSLQTKMGYKWTPLHGDSEITYFKNKMCEKCKSTAAVGATRTSKESQLKFICLLCTWQEHI